MNGTGTETGTWTSGHELLVAATSETKTNAACSPPGALTETLSDSAKHCVGLLGDAASAIAVTETAAWDRAERGTTTGFGCGYDYGCGGDPYLPTMTWNVKWRTVYATDDRLGPNRVTNRRAGPLSGPATFASSFRLVGHCSFERTTPCPPTTTPHQMRGQTSTVLPSKAPSWRRGPRRPRHRPQSW